MIIGWQTWNSPCNSNLSRHWPCWPTSGKDAHVSSLVPFKYQRYIPFQRSSQISNIPKVSLGGKDDLSLVVWNVQEARCSSFNIHWDGKCFTNEFFPHSICIICAQSGLCAPKVLVERVLAFVCSSQVMNHGFIILCIGMWFACR